MISHVEWAKRELAPTRAVGLVGRRGELLPPKRVREEAGLKPGDRVIYRAEPGRIEIVKIPGLRGVFPQKDSKGLF